MNSRWESSRTLYILLFKSKKNQFLKIFEPDSIKKVVLFCVYFQNSEGIQKYIHKTLVMFSERKVHFFRGWEAGTTSVNPP